MNYNAKLFPVFTGGSFRAKYSKVPKEYDKLGRKEAK